MYELTSYEKKLCSDIVECAFIVHKRLGPGFLEKVYEACFCHELSKKGIRFQRQLYLPVLYDGLQLEEGFRLDVLVEEMIICELKAVEEMNVLWQAQLFSHLKLTQNHIGFLINFNVSLIKNGIRRYCIK